MADYNSVKELYLIYYGGFPNYISEAEIRGLLELFGTLRFFNVIKSRETGNHEGYGFFAYHDPLVADVAIRSLNGMNMGMGDNILNVKRVYQESSTNTNSHGVNSLIQPMNKCRL